MRRNQTRKRRRDRTQQNPGVREAKLRGTDTLYVWVDLPDGGREQIRFTVPADIAWTRVVYTATDGVHCAFTPPAPPTDCGS